MDIEQAVAVMTRDPSRTAIFTDFDGTLAPIVDRPDAAVALDGTADVLGALAGRYALTAVVSGRSLRDLRLRIDPAGVVLAGSYGRERSDRDAGRPRVGGWEPVGVAASARLGGLTGVVIEYKGAGLAIHYRLAPHLESDVHRAAAELAADFELEVRPGRLVAELVAPGPGKDDAVAGLVEDYAIQTYLFAGDDLADLEVFEAARDAAADAVLVAVASEESPTKLAELADLVVSGPPDVLALFRRILSAAGPTGEPAPVR